MYDINLIRNLLIKTAMDGNFSICDTCIHQNDDNSCHYMNSNKCSSNLEEYVPNEDVINFKI